VNLTAARPKMLVSADGTGIISQAGAVLIAKTVRVTCLDRQLSAGLARWQAPRAVHDPGKIITDLAAAVALGGDCLADIAVLRSQPDLAGPVASNPVVSRLIARLAADAPRALKAIRAARAAARERAWALPGDASPGADGKLVTVDIDATVVMVHSEKAQATPTQEGQPRGLWNPRPPGPTAGPLSYSDAKIASTKRGQLPLSASHQPG
jgi:hypothetical protein